MSVRPGFKMTDVGEIPEEWSVAQFSDIVQEVQLGTTGRGSQRDKKIALVKMGNLVEGGFDLSELEYVDEESVQNLDSLLLEKGDYLFNTRNAADLVGKSAVWRGQISRATFDNNIMRIRFKP